VNKTPLAKENILALIKNELKDGFKVFSSLKGM
jgi:hypothetical protein